MGKKVGPDRRYTDAFRAEAVKLVQDGNVTQNEAARRLDMSVKTLGYWVRQARKGKLAARSSAPSELEAEVSRLRKEVASLKVDNEILKKAAAYFAKESR
jgi:transposase